MDNDMRDLLKNHNSLHPKREKKNPQETERRVKV